MNWQSRYLSYSFFGICATMYFWFVKFAHKNKIYPKMAPLGGILFFSLTSKANTKEFHRQHPVDMAYKFCV